MMRSDLVIYLYTWVLLILLVLRFWRFWCGGTTTQAVPKSSRRKREPKPFTGLTRKPECELCERESGSHLVVLKKSIDSTNLKY